MKTRTGIVALAILLTACGGGGDTPAASGPDTAVSNTPGNEPTGPSGPQRVEPRDGLVEPRATRFDKFKLRDGGRAVDLFFWSGVEECYGVDHIDVDYRDKVVEVTIFEGREPTAETCIELAVRKVVRVDLDERVGKRTVVDGGPTG